MLFDADLGGIDSEYTSSDFEALIAGGATLSQFAASVVNGALCKGCGSCATACPSNAAQVRHFQGRQIFAELDGIMDALSAVG